MAQWGAPAAVIAQVRERLAAEAKAAGIPVWPENWHAVTLFMAMETAWHWRPYGMGGAVRTGLRYEALDAVLPAVRRRVPRAHRRPYAALFDQLQRLEDAALGAIADEIARTAR